jgi:hypothetical protein
MIVRASLLVACGCGRVGFDVSRAGGDAAADTAVADVPVDARTPICHTGIWNSPVLLASLATGSEEADPSISPDELTLFFDSNRNTSLARAIWVSTRATTADPFGAPTRVAELDDAMDDYDPTLSSDGLEIWFGSLRSGTRELYKATRPATGSAFSAPTLVPIVGDGIMVRTGPELTPDGLGL